MIRGLVEAMIGKAGTSVLRFYEGHALVLGLIIVLYGVLMYVSWTNLLRIYRYLVAAAAATLTPGSEQTPQLVKPDGAKKSRQKTGQPELSQLPWQEAVDSVSFPLVASRAGLLPERKSVAIVKSIIDERELWKHTRAVADGANLRHISPEYRLLPSRQVGTHGKN